MNYDELNKQLTSLIEEVNNIITNLANASALLMASLDDINWAGFYLIDEGKLTLGPFQGKPACTQIQIGRGVCGTAAANNRVLRIDDVHKFKGHIACDSASNSEIVIPINKNGELFGVLDIDSPKFKRFSEEDQKGLEQFVKIIEGVI